MGTADLDVIVDLRRDNARLAALNAELRKALDSWQERLRVVVDAKDAGLLTELLDQELTTNAGLREENERLRKSTEKLLDAIHWWRKGGITAEGCQLAEAEARAALTAAAPTSASPPAPAPESGSS
jgi:hypothetical protein